MKRSRVAMVGAFLAGTSITPALAAEPIHAGIGGEYIQYFGYADNDGVGTGDFSGFDVKTDGTLFFTGDTTLDNGLQVGFEVGLEAQSAGNDQIDGNYLWLEHGYGRLEVGQNDSAAVLMHYAAPDVGFGINDSDIADWIVNPSNGDADSAFQSTYLYLGDDKATKISYFTPRLEGLQLGVSFVPEYERDDNAQPSGDIYHNGFAFGANYVESFGGLDVAVAAGYVHAEKPDGSAGGIKDAEGYSLGANLSYAGFTLGGSYADTKGNGGAGTDPDVSLDGRGFDIGIAYAFDAFQVSLSYYQGRFEDTSAAGDSKHRTVMLSGNYELGPGVSVLASVFRTRFEADTGTENDGWTALTGIALEF